MGWQYGCGAAAAGGSSGDDWRWLVLTVRFRHTILSALTVRPHAFASNAASVALSAGLVGAPESQFTNKDADNTSVLELRYEACS